jgi:hypothetical protein
MPKTYYHSPTNQPTAAHTADIEKLADITAPTGSTDFTITGIDGNGKNVAAFTTAAGEPSSAAWPTGDYTVRLDVPAMDSTVSFGLLTQGSGSGHLARVTGTLDSDIETVQQAAAFTTPGLKVITFAAQSWTAGADTDRLEILIAAVKTFGHGTDSLSIRCDGDGSITGPWTGSSNQPTGIQSADAELIQMQAADAEITTQAVSDVEIA